MKLMDAIRDAAESFDTNELSIFSELLQNLESYVELSEINLDDFANCLSALVDDRTEEVEEYEDYEDDDYNDEEELYGDYDDGDEY